MTQNTCRESYAEELPLACSDLRGRGVKNYEELHCTENPLFTVKHPAAEHLQGQSDDPAHPHAQLRSKRPQLKPSTSYGFGLPEFLGVIIEDISLNI